MKTMTCLLAMFLSCLIATTSVQADHHKKGEWKSLFNGKDLTGWEQVNGTATYVVDPKEKSILGTTAEGSPNSFLATEKEYGDFELKFEVMLIDNELNSGVMFRAHQYGEAEEFTRPNGKKGVRPAGRVYGYQCEIEAAKTDDNPNDKFGDAGFIYDEARRGWLSTDRSNEAARAAFKNGEWNEFRVKCVGDRLQTFVNDVPVADMRDSMDAAGKIMLQVHGIPKNQGPYSVQWRNIVLKDLTK